MTSTLRKSSITICAYEIQTYNHIHIHIYIHIDIHIYIYKHSEHYHKSDTSPHVAMTPATFHPSVYHPRRVYVCSSAFDHYDCLYCCCCCCCCCCCYCCCCYCCCVGGGSIFFVVNGSKRTGS